ncbi:MAG: aldolase [Actinomycetota bacterium]|nr:aldolase [Actinomycetota bacterium]
MWAALLDRRATDPDSVAFAYAARRRREQLLADDGTLFLVAADHPARGMLGTGPGLGSDPLAMADRRGLLERLLLALDSPEVDGVLGTPDVIEELLLLPSTTGGSVLDGKVVIGSMNRGGLAGAAWEIDDRFTGYDAATIAACGLNGGKMLVRLVDDDPGTASTLEGCARAVSELAAHGLMAMVEPLPYARDESGRLVLQLDTYSNARAVSVAAGLGATSAWTWLKLPALDEPERVLGASTLPALVLGGVPATDPAQDRAAWRRTLACPTAHGLVVGRVLLYPPDGDVPAAIEAAARVLRPARRPAT